MVVSGSLNRWDQWYIITQLAIYNTTYIPQIYLPAIKGTGGNSVDITLPITGDGARLAILHRIPGPPWRRMDLGQSRCWHPFSGEVLYRHEAVISVQWNIEKIKDSYLWCWWQVNIYIKHTSNMQKLASHVIFCFNWRWKKWMAWIVLIFDAKSFNLDVARENLICFQYCFSFIELES